MRSGATRAMWMATFCFGALATWLAGCSTTGTGRAATNIPHTPGESLRVVREHPLVMHVAADVADAGHDRARRIDMTLKTTDAGTSERVFESPIVSFGAPFYEALVSFNADVPAGAGMVMEIRVGRTGADEFFSPWMKLARWGEATLEGGVGRRGPVREFADAQRGVSGKVDVDYFRSTDVFDVLQYRVRAVGDVRLRRATMCATTPRFSWARDARSDGGPAVIDVPFRSQKTPDPKLSGRLCSPTSVTMLLAHRGVEQSVFDVAAVCLDQDYNIYGNWPRNVQGAYAFGVPGYLVRIGTIEQAERYLRRGQPLIASIIVDEPGELRNAPYKTTAGHLIVIRGVDERGDLLVNDPAAGDPATGQLVYHREDMINVWLRNTDGTTYVLLPRAE